MKRTAGVLALLAAAAGNAAAQGTFMSQVWKKDSPDGVHWGAYTASGVPGVQGPWGQPVSVAAPYSYSNVRPGETAARAMLAQSMPLDLVRQAGYDPGAGGQLPPGVIPPSNLIAPPGVPVAPGGPGGAGIPPGPGGVGLTQPVPPQLPVGLRPPGAVAAVGALTGPGVSPYGAQRTEVYFRNPPGMRVSWFSPNPEGRPGFSAEYLEAPARYNFLQASIYRLKLSNIPHHEGMALYPTIEVVPAKAKTGTFLAHSAVPVSFTEEDFEQVAAGNFVVKVIYLPDPQFQDLAATGPDEVVSSRLEPGMDPICEAQRRGSILLVVRLGNINLEAPNTPAMDAPNPFCPPAIAPAPAAPQMPPASNGVPPGPGRPVLPPPGADQFPTGRPLPGAPTGRLPDAEPATQPTAKGPPRTLAELASQLTNRSSSSKTDPPSR
jgi:hypothetical protein